MPQYEVWSYFYNQDRLRVRWLVVKYSLQLHQIRKITLINTFQGKSYKSFTGCKLECLSLWVTRPSQVFSEKPLSLTLDCCSFIGNKLECLVMQVQPIFGNRFVQT
jgi:hypothetical protein